MRRRREWWSSGFDDFLQLTGADQASTPVWDGLRVPDPAISPYYLFLLATTALVEGDEIVGIKTGIELGVPFEAGGVPPIAPLVLNVTTPLWRGFTDGAHSFILTVAAERPSQRRTGPFDGLASFSFEDSESPALVYETAVVGTALPGYLGLTAYTPPQLIGVSILNTRGVRYRMDDGAQESLRYVVDRPMRARLYGLVKQTDTSDTTTRFIPTLTATQIAALCPEDRFVNAFGVVNGARYWNIFGAIVTDTDRDRAEMDRGAPQKG
jgi:hypothetical protein